MTKPKKAKTTASSDGGIAGPKPPAKDKPRCGLCGKTRKLTKTECCDQWICDDEDNYVLFSYARNSCLRNHRRFTLCGFHSMEQHKGRWQDCKKCRKAFEPEIAAYYGTNEYNFEKMADPPAFEPTRCDACGRIINLATDGFTMTGRKKRCMNCFEI